MGILRNTYRKLLDSELGVVGVEMQRLEDALEVAELNAQSLRARLDLLVNRTGTRLSRLEKGQARGVAGPSDDEILNALRRSRGNGGDPFDESPW